MDVLWTEQQEKIENRREYVKNRVFILREYKYKTEIVGLTNIGKKKASLIIPTEVTYISTDSFKICHAKKINFCNVRKVCIEENVFKDFKNVTFYYKSEAIKRQLIRAGVNKNNLSHVYDKPFDLYKERVRKKIIEHMQKNIKTFPIHFLTIVFTIIFMIFTIVFVK